MDVFNDDNFLTHLVFENFSRTALVLSRYSYLLKKKCRCWKSVRKFWCFGAQNNLIIGYMKHTNQVLLITTMKLLRFYIVAVVDNLKKIYQHKRNVTFLFSSNSNYKKLNNSVGKYVQIRKMVAIINLKQEQLQVENILTKQPKFFLLWGYWVGDTTSRINIYSLQEKNILRTNISYFCGQSCVDNSNINGAFVMFIQKNTIEHKKLVFHLMKLIQ